MEDPKYAKRQQKCQHRFLRCRLRTAHKTIGHDTPDSKEASGMIRVGIRAKDRSHFWDQPKPGGRGRKTMTESKEGDDRSKNQNSQGGMTTNFSRAKKL